MSIRRLLRQAEIFPSPVTRLESLESGFAFGYAWKFVNYPFDAFQNIKYDNFSQEAREILAAANQLGISFTPDPRAVNATVLDAHTARLRGLLRAIEIPLAKEDGIDTSPAGFRKIREALSNVSKEHEAWFRAGMYTFSVTAPTRLVFSFLTSILSRVARASSVVRATSSKPSCTRGPLIAALYQADLVIP